MKYKIYTLGCKVNQYDSGDLGKKLNSIGFVITEKQADLVIVNTCAVTQSAIHKGKRMINKAKIENPNAKIVLMGCWPKIYKEDIDQMAVDLIWTVGDLDELIKKIKDIYKNIEIDYHQGLINKKNKTRYFIKVQDGCEQFCSYCIIPYTRGGLKSRTQDEVIAEIKDAVETGYQEVVLSGIHLGLYGREKESNKSNLVGLIKEMIKIEGLFRIRLSSIEVTEVTDELIELMRNNKKLCKHLHIPLQAGCDKILKLMNRPYNTQYFLEKIDKIRKAMPKIAISTDVIVGFPGETDEDFANSLDFIKKVNFSRVHVFSFSAHKKTPAYKMEGKVNKEDIKKRSEILRRQGELSEQEYKKRFVGKKLEVVIENEKRGQYKGKTEYYFDVEIDEFSGLGDIKKCVGKVREVILK